jgi:hypothetical protein
MITPECTPTLTTSMSKAKEGAVPETQAALRGSVFFRGFWQVPLDPACKGHFTLIKAHTV